MATLFNGIIEQLLLMEAWYEW